MTNPDASDLTPTLRAALDAPILERKGWENTLAPQLIALFLWIAFFDQIPAETLGKSNLLWPVAGVAAGGILGYLLLFRSAALWCFQSRRPTTIVLARTFGVQGSYWVPELLLTLSQLLWIAVATRYATLATLNGLEWIGLLDPSYQRPLTLGMFVVPGTLFLLTALAWAQSAAIMGQTLVRVIAALMNIYPIVPAFLLGLTAAVALRNVPEYQGRFVKLGGGRLGGWEGWNAALIAFQMTFAFFSAAALPLAEWGIVARERSDVTRGGWVGAAFAPVIVLTLALLCVAGTIPRWGPGLVFDATAYQRYSFIQALRTLIGGRTGGGMLLAFGLIALAPGCYAGFTFGEGMSQRFPRLTAGVWRTLGAVMAWGLVALGVGGHMRPLLDLAGVLFAPVCGAVAADYLRSRGRWPGARRGWNGPGVLAWGVGVTLAATPVALALLGSTHPAARLPSGLLGFLASFTTYLILAALGSEEAPHDAVVPRTNEGSSTERSETTRADASC